MIRFLWGWVERSDAKSMEVEAAGYVTAPDQNAAEALLSCLQRENGAPAVIIGRKAQPLDGQAHDIVRRRVRDVVAAARAQVDQIFAAGRPVKP